MGDSAKIILFGAGEFGRKALQYFGAQKVAFLADNNASKVGTKIDGVPVISFAELKRIYENYQIVISVDPQKSFVLAAQLDEAGIKNYTRFLDLRRDVREQAVPSEIICQNPSIRGPESNGKKALMVAYHFPPLGGSGVFRSIKFVKYLPCFHWNPTVISSGQALPDWDYVDESLLAEIPNGTKIIRIPDMIATLQSTAFPDYKDRVLDFLRNILKRSKRAVEIFETFASSGAGKAELLTFPCVSLIWAYDVIQYMEKNLDLRQFQVIFTTSGPYSAHLIGFYFREKYGIPWVADYRDPWIGNAYSNRDLSSLRTQLLMELEGVLLKAADCNLTVLESLRVQDLERFGISEDKIISIPNGYDEVDFEPLREPSQRLERFTINFSGLLYGNRRIDVIFNALLQLTEEEIDPEQILFRFVGESAQYDIHTVARAYGLESILYTTGYISHSVALQTNLDSNILLQITGDEEVYRDVMGGKMYDYLRSGRPILAIAPEGSVVDQILRETGHGTTFRSTQIVEIKRFILKEYHKWQRCAGQELLHSPLIEQFERKNLTKQLVEVFDTVTGSNEG